MGSAVPTTAVKYVPTVGMVELTEREPSMRPILFVAIFVAMPGWLATAQDSAHPSLGERLRAIGDKFFKAREDFAKEYRAASAPERASVLAKMPPVEPYVARIWEQIALDPKAEGADEGMVWIVRYSDDTNDHRKAGRLLVQHHAEREAIEGVILKLSKIDDGLIRKGIAGVMARKWAVIDDDPESDEARVALLWIVRSASDDADKEQAGSLLFTYHGTHEDVISMIPRLARIDHEDIRAGILEVVESGSTKEARGQALHALADGMLGIRNLRGGEPGDANEDEICALLQRVEREFGDVAHRRGTLGDEARKALEDIESRGVGRPALNTEAEDTDGVSFKLSDYRGKAVLLDFWGHW